MKLFTGWVVSAGLVCTVAAANAQVLVPYGIARSPYAASGIGGSYAAMPQDAPVRRYGPTLLPPEEVYSVVRDNGFLPLGIPQQRGLIYTISVIDRGGDDGRLVIDARTGRIIRFMPAYPNEDLTVSYGPPPPISALRGAPRPPGSIPHVASRTVPVPKASPLAAKPAREPTEQSAAVEPKPADAQPIPPAAASTLGQARPAAPTIQPTQEMPKVQGLE
jgi:hypothetical protein